jgi:hypothetical protein
MVDYAARREAVETRLFGYLADDGDAPASVHRKIDRLLHHVDLASSDSLDDDHMFLSSDSDLFLLTIEQHEVASKIIEAVLYQTHQLMFLQGSAGTGKTFSPADRLLSG